MKKYGLKVNKPSPEQVQIWNELINSMSADIRGSLIEENAYDRLMEIKKEMESR